MMCDLVRLTFVNLTSRAFRYLTLAFFEAFDCPGALPDCPGGPLVGLPNFLLPLSERSLWTLLFSLAAVAETRSRDAKTAVTFIVIEFQVSED
jgi:hypothetical protein